MPDEFDKWLRALGLAPGASEQAIKEAYRDLVKVWHPDRFGTDARLRQKAEEKLKEVNAAFEHLRGYRPSASSASQGPRPSAAADAERPRPTASPREYAYEPPAAQQATPKYRPTAAALIASAVIGSVSVWLLLSGRDVREPFRAGTVEAPVSATPTRTAAPPPHSAKRESTESAVAQTAASTPASTPAPTSGSLRVESQPTGGRVSVDGKVVGKTPVIVTDVTPGEHQIGIDLEAGGYEPWSSPVVVVAGREEKLLAVMSRK